jgi:hypothetical protein
MCAIVPSRSCVQARLFANVRYVTDNLNFLEDGWVLWSRSVPGTTEGLTVLAKLYADKKGDRSEIVELHITGRRLTTDKLRSIPLGHIEAIATTDPNVTPSDRETPPAPMSQAANALGRRKDQLLLDAAHRKAEEADRKARQPHEPLTRPNGSNPDAFYQQVAEAYRDVVQITPKVAKALADEANVPVGTVHRWVLEARRRGFLPPARQGRAG